MTYSLPKMYKGKHFNIYNNNKIYNYNFIFNVVYGALEYVKHS